MKNFLVENKTEEEIKSEIQNIINENINFDLEASEDNYKIYLHLNKENGKGYFGQTKQEPTKRWKNGKKYKSNEYFNNSIEKNGWDAYYHLVLVEGLSLKSANKLEEFLISYFNTTNRLEGYNQKFGGDNCKLPDSVKKKISEKAKGRKLSDEAKEKLADAAKKWREANPNAMSEASKKFYAENPEARAKAAERCRRNTQNSEFRQKQSELMKELIRTGKITKEHFEASRKKLIEWNKTHPFNPNNETRKKMAEYLSENPIYRFAVILTDTKSGEEQEFESVQKLSEYLHADRCTVRRYLKDENLIFRSKYKMRYKDEKPIYGRVGGVMYGNKNGNSKPIIATKISTGEEIEFQTIEECTKFIGLKRHCPISNCLHGRGTQSMGYTFRYKEEDKK